MKQKVQIDVLDVSLYESESKNEIGEKDFTTSIVPSHGIFNLIKSKGLIIGCCCLFLVTLAGYYIVYSLKTANIKNSKIVQNDKVSTTLDQHLINLHDFVINFTDKNGKERILICGLFLEMSNNKSLTDKDIMEIRKIINNILCKFDIQNFFLLHNKDILKEKIFENAKRKFGRQVLSNIYFIKFTIL